MNPPSSDRLAPIARESGRGLLRFIRSKVRSEADAEDLLQEVWRQLAVALNTGPIEQVGAWLYTVARRRIADHYRKRRPESLDALTANPDTAFDFTPFALRDERTPRTEHLRLRFWSELRTALDELPAAQREVFIWHELEGLSFETIAARTGEKLNTLLSRKRYAVLHLRKRLAGLHTEFASPHAALTHQPPAS